MIRAYLRDRWWSLIAVAAMGIVAAVAPPPYWKILIVFFWVLFPLSYLG
jgi:hypothetical protein